MTVRLARGHQNDPCRVNAVRRLSKCFDNFPWKVCGLRDPLRGQSTRLRRPLLKLHEDRYYHWWMSRWFLSTQMGIYAVDCNTWSETIRSRNLTAFFVILGLFEKTDGTQWDLSWHVIGRGTCAVASSPVELCHPGLICYSIALL